MAHSPRLLAASAAAVLVLAGCGTIGGGSSATLRVTWWGNPDRAAATQAAIRLFEAAHPDISVQLEPSAYPGYYDKLNTEITAGDAPDVIQIDTVARYATENALVDLDTESSVLSTAAIPRSYLDQGSYDGKTYEVPAGSNVFALVYNSALVSQARATVPGTSLSWAQYAALARQISASAHGKYWGSGDDSANTQAFEIFVRQRGGNLYSADGKHVGFTAKDLADWWNYWAAMRADGACPPATVTEPGVSGDVTKAAIARDQVAMDGYGTSTSLPGTGWRYAAFPGENPRPGVYLKRSVSWAIYSGSRSKTDAAELISFLVNDERAGQALGLTRGAPTASNVLSTLSAAVTGNDKQIVDYTRYAAEPGHNSPPPSPEPPASAHIDSPELFAQLAEEVWFGRSTVQAAANSFVSQANALLASGS